MKKWMVVILMLLLAPLLGIAVKTYVSPDIEGEISTAFENPEVLQTDWHGRSGLVFFTSIEQEEEIFCQGHAIKEGLSTEVTRESCVPLNHTYEGEGMYGRVSFNGQTILRGFTSSERSVTVPGDKVVEVVRGNVKSWYAFVDPSSEVEPIFN